jgi:hypothetical protein
LKLREIPHTRALLRATARRLWLETFIEGSIRAAYWGGLLLLGAGVVHLFSGALRWQQGALLAGLTAVVIAVGSIFRRRSLEHVAQTADHWCGAHQLFCSALELTGLTTEQRRGAGAYVLRQSEKRAPAAALALRSRPTAPLTKPLFIPVSLGLIGAFLYTLPVERLESATGPAQPPPVSSTPPTVDVHQGLKALKELQAELATRTGRAAEREPALGRPSIKPSAISNEPPSSPLRVVTEAREETTATAKLTPLSEGRSDAGEATESAAATPFSVPLPGTGAGAGGNLAGRNAASDSEAGSFDVPAPLPPVSYYGLAREQGTKAGAAAALRPGAVSTADGELDGASPAAQRPPLWHRSAFPPSVRRYVSQYLETAGEWQ